MNRGLGALLLCGILAAQGWEAPGALVSLERPEARRKGNEVMKPFLVRRTLGKPDERLAMPVEAESGGGGVALTHGSGCSLLLAPLNHPALRLQREGPGGRRLLVPSDRLTRFLFRSTDFRTWERHATYGQDPHGRAARFYPLEDGSFLAQGGLFWVGDDISPFAVYQRDAQGQMRLVRLVDLGLGGPVFRAEPDGKGGRKPVLQKGMAPWSKSWRSLLQTQAGYLCLNSSGYYVFLDARNARAGARGCLVQDPDRRLSLHRVLARPDGKVLVLGSQSRRFNLEPWVEADPEKARGSVNMRALVRLSLVQPDPWFSVFQDERPFWGVVDPSTGGWHPMSPPLGFPPAGGSRSLWGLRGLTMRPDGNLTWAFDR